MIERENGGYMFGISSYEQERMAVLNDSSGPCAHWPVAI